MKFFVTRSCAAFLLVLSGAIAVRAEPIRLHGVETAYLLPDKSFEFRLGSHQANPAGQKVGTGLQVYEGGVAYRGESDWQFGVRFSSYDDMPAGVIDGGDFGHLSLIGFGLDAKRDLIASEYFSWAISASIEALAFGSRIPEDDSTDHISGSISAPMSIRLSPNLKAHIDPSIAKLPNELKGGEGFGLNVFLGAGLSWQANTRVMAYAEIDAPLFGRGNTVDTDGDIAPALAWSLGTRIRIAPAADLDIYASNRVAGTSASSGLVLPPMGEVPSFGAQILYQPGRQDPAFLPTPANLLRPEAGFLLRNGAIMPANTWDLAVAAGHEGSFSGALSYSPDPGLQLDVILERHAVASNDYSVPPGTDPLFQVGGRFQAIAPSATWPLWVSAGILAGRTLDFETRPWEPGRPTVGFIYADASATVVLEGGPSITLQPRAAAWRNEMIGGLGVGATFDLGEKLDVVAEASLNTSGPVTWASGFRWQGSEHLSVSAFATNAIGHHGHGSILAAQSPRLEVKLEAKF